MLCNGMSFACLFTFPFYASQPFFVSFYAMTASQPELPTLLPNDNNFFFYLFRLFASCSRIPTSAASLALLYFSLVFLGVFCGVHDYNKNVFL
jgi:hypothetical protein